MRFSSPFLASTISLSAALSGTWAATCTSPLERKEWRAMDQASQTEYLNAVKCLMNAPAKGKAYFPAVKSRFDDFAAMHINGTQGLLECTGGIHLVGQLFPWHRYAVSGYENALINECSYTGAQPYWDWTKDASNFASSPVFDPVYGFGGNGKPAPLPPTSTNPETLGGSGGGCVQTGPFVGSDVVHLAPGATVASASRCLVRNFNENMAKNLLQESNVAPALAATTYFDFNRILNPPDKIAQISVAHTGGHVSVGGDMGDQYSSTIDPLFWLHHAQLDRLWTTWQSGSTARLTDMDGPTQACTTLGKTTLDMTLWMGFNLPSRPIRDVMDTQNGALCYKYV